MPSGKLYFGDRLCGDATWDAGSIAPNKISRLSLTNADGAVAETEKLPRLVRDDGAPGPKLPNTRPFLNLERHENGHRGWLEFPPETPDNLIRPKA